MLNYRQGNLLEAGTEALVNTVNTVGVMGKGLALMFKETFRENYRLYADACKRDEVKIGEMFVTERSELQGSPRWIINFPTKKHWRKPTKLEWVEAGLCNLHQVIKKRRIRSVAIPPLGCGNGGLDWTVVRPLIEKMAQGLPNVDVYVYEPTRRYQKVAKRRGVDKLTPPRAMIAEMVRRYWVLDLPCSILEIQKLAYFLEKSIADCGLENHLDLRFSANRYGPYSDRLRHLLDKLDGSYLHCEKRIPDANPTDIITFDDRKRERVAAYLRSEATPYLEALEVASRRIDGFESPLGMELLATVDWLLSEKRCFPELGAIKVELSKWSGGGAGAAERKLRIFDDRLLRIALERLTTTA